MKALIHNSITQKPQTIFVGIAVAVFAFAGVAGAMQEYEDLKLLVAESEVDINKAEGRNNAAYTWVLGQIERIKKAALFFASKVKAYIKSKKMMTSSDALEATSDNVFSVLDTAIARTKANRRSTVKAQDL